MKESNFYIATQTTNILLLPTSRKLTDTTTCKAPRPQTLSFLDSLANTSTPACVSLSSLVQQLNDHQALNKISFLIILSMCKGNHLQISQEIHTYSKQSNLKNVARVSLLYLEQNIKPYTSYGLRAELEILQKKNSARLSIDRV